MKPPRYLLLAFALVAGFWLFAVDVLSPHPPPTAAVFLDLHRSVYFSPPLVYDDKRRFVVKEQLASAQRRGVKPASKADELLSEGWGDPQTARVWTDLGRKTYSWEPPMDAIFVRRVTFSEAQACSAEPDSQHEREGGFMYSRSQLGVYLEQLGLRPSRWSSSGEWNW